MNTFSYDSQKISANSDLNTVLETKANLSNNLVKMFNSFKTYDVVLNYVYL